MKRFALTALALVVIAVANVIPTSAWGTQAGNDLLQLLPDGGALVVVDAQKVTSSALWNSADARTRLNSLIDRALSDVPDLGLRLADIQTAVIVLPAGSVKNPTAALTGRFSRAEILAGLKANQKVKLASEKYRDFDVYTATRVVETGTKTGEVSFVFYDDRTIVVGAAASVRGSIDVKSGAGTSVAKNAKLGALIAQNPAAAIRFAVEVTPAMATALNSTQLPLPDFSSVNLVFGSIDINSSIELNATLRNDTPAHAKAIADRLNGVLGMARGYLGADPKNAVLVAALKAITITAPDADVKIVGSLPLTVLGQAR